MCGNQHSTDILASCICPGKWFLSRLIFLDLDWPVLSRPIYSVVLVKFVLDIDYKEINCVFFFLIHLNAFAKRSNHLLLYFCCLFSTFVEYPFLGIVYFEFMRYASYLSLCHGMLGEYVSGFISYIKFVYVFWDYINKKSVVHTLGFWLAII